MNERAHLDGHPVLEGDRDERSCFIATCYREREEDEEEKRREEECEPESASDIEIHPDVKDG